MFPFVPLLCMAAIFGGAGGLYWYETLSAEQKARADRLTAEFAWSLYQRSVQNLTQEQAKHVATLVRNRLGV